MSQNNRLTNVLLVVIAILLMFNLTSSFASPVVARAKNRDPQDRIADALEKIVNDGIKVKGTGEYGYGPLKVQIEK